MALINPCDIEAGSVSNTGIECDSSLGVAKGIFIVAPNYKWSKEDMADTSKFFQDRIHATGSSRFFPVLQGIFDFAISNESDVSETNPITGTVRKLRSGGFTLTYTYEKGGLCLAKALLGFGGKGYRFIIADQNNQILVRKNADGTYSGLKSSDISSSITPASSTSTFKNILSLGVSQDEYIHYSELLKSDEDITDFNGLIDVEVYDAGGSSTSVLKVGVRTECAETDLVKLYQDGATNPLANLANFIVRNADGTTHAVTAISIVNGAINLAGTFTTGKYTVELAAPSVLLSHNIEGYEGIKKAEITI